MKRSFYFLKDSVTGNYYNGENCYDIGHFDTAAVYWKRENAEKRINRLINAKYSGSWEWTQKYLETYNDNKEKWRSDVELRKSLPNWGIEVVEVEVSG